MNNKVQGLKNLSASSGGEGVKTNVEEFKKFHKLLIENAPPDYTPFYFKCDKEGKNPHMPSGKWLEAGLTIDEAIAWLEENGNIGIAGLNEDQLVIIDIDDETITDYKTLKTTLTARSGSRTGVHLFYFEDMKGGIPNIPTDEAGEIRANNQYVIAPGSYVTGYEDNLDNIGKYTVEVAINPTKITLSDIPSVFCEQLAKTKKNIVTVAKRQAKNTNSDMSAFFNLSVYDIITDVSDPQKRFPSIFHASKTGENTSISSKGLIQCWRHHVSMNAQQALCVLSGFLTCQEAGEGHTGGGAGPSLYTGNDEALFHAWKYARENIYIPEDDPIPGRVLRYISIAQKFCKEADIKDGWKLPKAAYKKANDYLEREDKATESKKEEETKQNATEKIILLALSHGELVHDQHNEGFALIDGMGGNKKALKLRTREFKIFLAKLVWDAEAQGIGSDVLSSALNTLEGKALFDGKACFLYNRIGSNDGSIFYDLGNERVIQISSAGWHFVEDAPTLFRKEQHQKPQVTPTKGGDINKLWTIINLKDKGDRVLFVACLVSMFMDNIDHPIPVWIGEQGSGKTVSSETVKSLIDPSSLETTALSKDEESFLLTLYHNWLSIFDNVGEVKPWQSDILSRAITGGGLSRRRRYTDEEEQLYNFRRCIMINGLLLPLTAPDVMDRSLLFKLSRFKQHLSRKEIEENFERNKPEIFGALLDLVAKTLKILETEEIAAPPGIRLYDFGVVGEAAARAYGAKNGDFLELFLKKKADDNLEVIQSSLFGSVLYSLIDNGDYIGAGDAKYPFLDEERK